MVPFTILTQAISCLAVTVSNWCPCVKPQPPVSREWPLLHAVVWECLQHRLKHATLQDFHWLQYKPRNLDYELWESPLSDPDLPLWSYLLQLPFLGFSVGYRDRSAFSQYCVSSYPLPCFPIPYFCSSALIKSHLPYVSQHYYLFLKVFPDPTEMSLCRPTILNSQQMCFPGFSYLTCGCVHFSFLST